MNDRHTRLPVVDARSGGRENAWAVRRSGRWLLVDLGREHRTLGWTIVGGGFARTRSIAWLGVRDGDLPAGVDPVDLVDEALRAVDADPDLDRRQPVFLTSSNLDAYIDVTVEVEEVAARCIATVGMSNAARVGARSQARERANDRSQIGTINLLCGVSRPLTELAMIEALSIVTAARTTAVLEARIPIRSGEGQGSADLATGTGTDCCIVAAPAVDAGDGSTGATAEVYAYAGLHTAIGEAIGRAALQAVARGVAAWREAAAR